MATGTDVQSVKSESRINSRLAYVKSGVWTPIPEWAESFIQIGSNLFESANSSSRTILTVALPTRSYAAVFAAVGSVSSGLSKSFGESQQEGHFSRLLALKPGTEVRILQKGKWTRGKIEDTTQMNGEKAIRVLTQTARHQCILVRKKEAPQVRIEAGATWNLPKHQKPRSIDAPIKFLYSLLGEKYEELFSKAVCDVVIIGHLATLREETKDTLFNTTDKTDSTDSGTLHDILRPKYQVTATEPYRSEFFSSTQSATPEIREGDRPSLVIFDGALAYLKCRHHWPRENWLILLDRTEPQFEPAVRAANEEFTQRQLITHLGPVIPALPSALQSRIYQETVR